jgi:hypothetical protein
VLPPKRFRLRALVLDDERRWRDDSDDDVRYMPVPPATAVSAMSGKPLAEVDDADEATDAECWARSCVSSRVRRLT